jgi:hypothetical protein
VQDEDWHRVRCGVAPGYRHVMHRLCIDCHRMEESKTGAQEPYLTRCSCCHRSARKQVDVKADLIVRHDAPAARSPSHDHG